MLFRSVSSQPDAGTSVRIYLPAEKKIARDRTPLSSDLNGTQTILMVDDEDLMLTMGQTVLSTFGYRVLTANSGEKALQVFHDTKSTIDLLITDMVMPKMNGRELIEKVRGVSPATRVLCATACTRSLLIEKQLDFLTKPFTAQQLLRKAREALTAQVS